MMNIGDRWYLVELGAEYIILRKRGSLEDGADSGVYGKFLEIKISLDAIQENYCEEPDVPADIPTPCQDLDELINKLQ